ncbi:MAG: hypothetical protein QW165_01000 [Candidatus Woesearchaeota archaeon]
MAEEYFIVSFDFDGVLAQGYKVKMKYAKEWFGVDLSLDQTKKKGLEGLMKNLGKNIKYRDLMDPLNEHHIMEYEVPAGCIDALSQLYSQNYRFVVISSRNDHNYPYALKFIKEKFGGLIKYGHYTRNEPKGRFVKRLKPRVHVDDDISKLIELFECPVELVYFRQPENSGQEIPALHKNRIWQAESFADVKVIVERIKYLHSAICRKENIQNKWTNVERIFKVLHSLSPSEINEL